MSSKNTFPLGLAQSIAKQLVSEFAPSCERIEIVGSVRREKPEVGDVELLYIPKMVTEPDPADMFATRQVNLADLAIERLIKARTLEVRLSKAGLPAYGPKNKLMVHVASGIPVDLFAATAATWPNMLVCRTGPADLNRLIAERAQARGYSWNVYGEGFTHLSTQTVIPMTTEDQIFRFMTMDCLHPSKRHTLVPK